VESAEPVDRAMRTAAIRGGMSTASHNGSISVPIYQSATFERSVVLGDSDEVWDYSRIANPTRSALEECVRELEGAVDVVATASGMAAITLAVMSTCHSGSHVVLADNVYGGTWDLFEEVFSAWEVAVTVVDMRDLDAVRRAMRPTTDLVWAETPSNPMLKVVDIAAIAKIAHGGRATLAVDSTFATPVLQQPLALGADLVVHSTTKYLGGHSDVTGGVIALAGQHLAERVRKVSGITGSVAAPFDSWLVLRGIRTLPVRMAQICANAVQVAQFLQAHPRVSAVHYPGLASHPDHLVAARQMTGFGGVVSFEYDGDLEAAAQICSRTKVFTLAVSLGGVESLIQQPAQMTHCTTGGTEVGVPPSLIRLAIGLESADDLIADLGQALSG
jgi:cystathionine gamma-synthase